MRYTKQLLGFGCGVLFMIIVITAVMCSSRFNRPVKIQMRRVSQMGSWFQIVARFSEDNGRPPETLYECCQSLGIVPFVKIGCMSGDEETEKELLEDSDLFAEEVQYRLHIENNSWRVSEYAPEGNHKYRLEIDQNGDVYKIYKLPPLGERKRDSVNNSMLYGSSDFLSGRI